MNIFISRTIWFSFRFKVQVWQVPVSKWPLLLQSQVAALYFDEALLFVPEQPAICSFDKQNTHRPRSALSTCSSSSTDVEWLERWEERRVKLLIACYAEYKHCFEKGKSTKKIILEQIASTFKSDDVKVSGE